MESKDGQVLRIRRTSILSEFIRFISAITIVVLLSCSSDINQIKTLTSPIILIVKSDTLNIVQDAGGKKYVLNIHDIVDYRIAFMNVGDTLLF